MVYQLTDGDINFLLNKLNPIKKSYEKGENIKTSKKYSHMLCLVTDGLAYLYIENDNFERNILRILKKGDIFSNSMLLSESQGVSYFAAKKSSSIAYFNEKEIISFLSTDNDYKEYRERLAGLLGGIIEQQALTHNYILQQKTIRAKLLAYIKSEMEIQQSDTIKVPIPYSDLAEYLGIDRSAMMKELSKMKEQNIITEYKKTISMHNA